IAVSAGMVPAQPNAFGFPATPDVVAAFLMLGVHHGIDIHVGLSVTWDFASSMRDPHWLAREVALTKVLAGELLDKFGNVSSFKGFYIPYEIHQGTDAGEEEGRQYGAFIGEITNAIREAEADHGAGSPCLLSLAPFVSRAGWIPRTIAFWTYLLAGAGIDVLMIQDGVGVHRLGVGEDLAIEYKIIQDACAGAGAAFWTDLEIFDIDTWLPATMGRVQAQLELECKYVEKIIVFDIPHYMSLQYSNASAGLYAQYEAYLSC
nr:DUF4434 domain-containing protein [Candidatus Sigynarchaeota archaeon]